MSIEIVGEGKEDDSITLADNYILSPFGKDKRPLNTVRWLEQQHISTNITSLFSTVGSNVLLRLTQEQILRITGYELESIKIIGALTSWKANMCEEEDSRANEPKQRSNK